MVTIHVVPLPKIRIHAPLTRLETGTTMPLLALGLDEHQVPSAYASAIPPLLLEWTTSNKQVVSLPGVFVKVIVVSSVSSHMCTFMFLFIIITPSLSFSLCYQLYLSLFSISSSFSPLHLFLFIFPICLMLHLYFLYIYISGHLFLIKIFVHCFVCPPLIHYFSFELI